MFDLTNAFVIDEYIFFRTRFSSWGKQLKIEKWFISTNQKDIETKRRWKIENIDRKTFLLRKLQNGDRAIDFYSDAFNFC